ncbi:MAG: hypothetical protein WCK78_06665 [Paludibacter sp.]
MKQIKAYLKDWNYIRILKLVLGLSILISYHYNNENLFLMIGTVLSIQAIFNLSCPGGSCNVSTDKDTKQIVKTEKYEPKN